MGKIKIRLIILGLVLLIGLVIGAVASADSLFNTKDFDNNKTKYISDEIVVKFKGDVRPFRVLKIPEGKVGEKIKEYLKRADVEYVEPNYIAYALLVPNDPYYRYQWNLNNSVYGGIQMEEAWDVSSGAGVTVAVVDTGIRKGTDLAQTCFVSGYDYVNNDSDPTDDNGHGTHVAGTLSQSTNNGVGVAGVAYKSCLMPVRVLDATGAGTYANVALGIRYAADNGAKVINLSLGGSSDSQTLKNAVAYAYGKGVTVVAAAGNEGENILNYPATYDDYVIAVGATQYDETKTLYSNYGPSLDLVAPGGNTSADQNGDGYGDGILQQTFRKIGRIISWGYYFFQGTSMAAAHVSGVSALLIANGNTTTPDQVRAALQETAEDKGVAGWDETYGWGLVDAYKALQWTTAPIITCSSDTECEDGNPCTTDICLNPGTIDAFCGYQTISVCSSGDGCCPAGCTYETDADCPVAVKCWSGSNQYLYRNNGQTSKFCKCASGTYGYNRYNYTWSQKTVFYYLDLGNNENWDTTLRSSNLPIYQIICIDGTIYPTNQDYYYPK